MNWSKCDFGGGKPVHEAKSIFTRGKLLFHGKLYQKCPITLPVKDFKAYYCRFLEYEYLQASRKNNTEISVFLLDNL